MPQASASASPTPSTVAMPAGVWVGDVTDTEGAYTYRGRFTIPAECAQWEPCGRETFTLEPGTVCRVALSFAGMDAQGAFVLDEELTFDSGNWRQGPCVAAQTVLTKEDGTLAYDWKVGGTIYAKGTFRPLSVP